MQDLLAHQTEIIKRLKRGETPLSIRRFVKVSGATITRYAKALGLKFKPGRPTGCGKAVEEMRKTAQRLKSSGQTYKQISKQFGVSRQRVHQLLAVPKCKLKSSCAVCRSKKRLSAHHTNYLADNFITLCSACHTRLHMTKHPHLKRNGGLVKTAHLWNPSSDPVDKLRFQIVTTILKKHLWNLPQAAKELNVSRATLYGWIAQWAPKRPKTR